jgi:hypothetical protein
MRLEVGVGCWLWVVDGLLWFSRASFRVRLCTIVGKFGGRSVH